MRLKICAFNSFNKIILVNLRGRRHAKKSIKKIHNKNIGILKFNLMYTCSCRTV